jgi:RNA polymerase sigma-70 factor (ECF subfamily)
LKIARRGPETMTFSERTANGRPGLVAEQGGAVVTVFAFEVVGDRITRIWVVRNPEELRHWTAA